MHTTIPAIAAGTPTPMPTPRAILSLSESPEGAMATSDVYVVSCPFVVDVMVVGVKEEVSTIAVAVVSPEPWVGAVGPMSVMDSCAQNTFKRDVAVAGSLMPVEPQRQLTREDAAEIA
jgi:hypothetical protein